MIGSLQARPVKVAPNGQAGRADPADEPGRHLDARIAGLCGDRGPGGAGEQHRVEPVPVHIRVEPQGSAGAQIGGAGGAVFKLRQIARRCLGGEKDVLTEAQRPVGIARG